MAHGPWPVARATAQKPQQHPYLWKINLVENQPFGSRIRWPKDRKRSMERVRRYERWLGPFQKFTWLSEKHGYLEIAGEAASGSLRIATATARARLADISVEGQSIFLTKDTGERLKLIPTRSDCRRRAVWGYEGGDQDVWHVVRPADEGPAARDPAAWAGYVLEC